MSRLLSRLNDRPILAAGAVALVAFIVYLTTLAPTVDFIDDGELATVCYTLGIAHPTGYPLFTLVGWLFSHLPIASTVILRLNIMAAFFTALGAGAVVMLAHEIFQNWMPARLRRPAKQRTQTKSTQRTKGTKRIQPAPVQPKPEPPAQVATNDFALPAAIASGIAAAFSITWWSQSTSIEVYPLQCFLLPTVLTFFLRMLREEESEVFGKNAKLFALTLGLAFANHMTTVWLAPACLYMFFARYRFAEASFKKVLRLAPFFLAGLALYLYLPIRSAMYPLMDWGHPTTWGAFWRHFFAKQYTSVWLFTGTEAAAKQWSHFWHQAPHEFTWIGALVALAGIYAMFFAGSLKRAHIMIFTALLFFTCLFVAINYDIHDIDSYFLLSFLVISIWTGAGIMLLSKSIATSRGMAVATTALVAAAVLGVLEIGLNRKEVDESGNYMVEDFTLNVLRNVPPHSIVFSTLWDFWVSGAFYYQNVEKIRPDVLVIDKAMLRDRSWYYSYLEQRAPEVFARVKPEEQAFLKYLRAFEAGEPFNGEGIAPAYQKFTSALVERNQDRPIFITQEMVDSRDDLFAPDWKPMPGGILYRLAKGDTTFDAPAPNVKWRDQDYRKRDYYTDDARILQASPLAVYAQAMLRKGEKTKAEQYLDAALKFKPDVAASIDDLPERDQSVAEAANERFAAIENVRKHLSTEK